MRYESTKKEFFLKCQGINRAMSKGISVGTEIQKELSGAGIFKERAGGQDSHAKQSGRWLHDTNRTKGWS